MKKLIGVFCLILTLVLAWIGFEMWQGVFPTLPRWGWVVAGISLMATSLIEAWQASKKSKLDEAATMLVVALVGFAMAAYGGGLW